MTDLPTAFVDRVQHQLSDPDAFLAALDAPRVRGLRIDPRKTTAAQLAAVLGHELQPVPWCSESFVVAPDTGALGSHPLHTAGAFYLQEPAAALPVVILDPQPDDYVLDLCAAPGGKSTQIAARLGARGVLVSNDATSKRARALAGTLDRWGSKALVTANAPAQLGQRWVAAFDRVLVDAPCSGEGMFRREPEARQAWSVAAVAGCARRQGEILDDATPLLRPGGTLVYSTCTFAPEENEQVILSFLASHPGWEIDPIDPIDSVDVDEWGLARVWPHHGPGEGQFVARLRAPGYRVRHSFDATVDPRDHARRQDAVASWESFAREHLAGFTAPGAYVVAGDTLYATASLPTDGLAVLRPGLPLGQARPGRFEPSAALTRVLDDTTRVARVELQGDDLARYTTGDAVAGVDGHGWVVVTSHGCALGWGRVRDTNLRSMFPKPWRNWVQVREGRGPIG